MNDQFMDCMSTIAPEHREALREWATIKVEIGACHDKPDIMERCHRWGEQWYKEQVRA